MEIKFYICETCGNVVEKVRDSGVEIICCGRPMTRIEANTKEASIEKHIPVVTEENNMLNIQVGSVPHPMTEEHLIEWILVVTPKAVKRFNLTSKDEPSIKIPKEENIETYAYCNVHGLWKLKS